MAAFISKTIGLCWHVKVLFEALFVLFLMVLTISLQFTMLAGDVTPLKIMDNYKNEKSAARKCIIYRF